MTIGLRPTKALAVAGVLASTGSAVVGACNLLSGQVDQARTVIPKAWDSPPRADGVYSPGGGAVRRWDRDAAVGVHLMVFGDSTATGYGCSEADEVPGVLLARGLAERSDSPVRLSTKALVGATSKGLSGQVDAMLVAGPPPDAALIMIGANDVTSLNAIGASARRLGAAVGRLRSAGAVVIVGTCPDLGVVTAIPQPLRWTARAIGLCLVAPHFHSEPDRLFAHDRYHPSAAGYALAAEHMLPALCEALGHETGQVIGKGPSASRFAPLGRLLRRPAS